MASMNKIAISNLAFKDKPLGQSLKFLQNSQISGLEIAPTLIWNDPLLVSKKERNSFKGLVSDHGLSIIALQSLLFGRPELQLISGSSRDGRLLVFLKKMVDLCSDLGGSSLSFGSPRNRVRGNLELNDAISIATPVFYELAAYAKMADILICIEPVSSEFRCDFINTIEECVQLVESVEHSHFRLLLDTGTLINNKEECRETIRRNACHISHVHINDPNLFPPSNENMEHSIIVETLRSIDYQNWLTLEFLSRDQSLAEDVAYGLECYAWP